VEQANVALSSELAKLQQEAADRKAARSAVGSTARGEKQDWGALWQSMRTNEAVVAGLNKMVQTGLRHQVEARLATLKLRLKLTDDQDRQLRTLADAKLATAGDLAARAMQGKASREELEAARSLYTDARSEMQQVLTAEQWADYQKYETEQQDAQAQTYANVELLRLQTALQLDQQQQEKVFSVLYQEAKQSLDPATGGNPFGGWGGNWARSAETRSEALKPILTPEQFDAYQKLNAQRAEAMRLWHGGGTANGGGGGGQ
jgi:hypothetical protein